RLARALLDPRRLFEEERGRRGLGDEAERAVRIDGDHRRDRSALLHLLRRGVERLAEFHDVHAALAQSGADRRRRIGDARGHLQLDIAGDFLCHCLTLVLSRWTPDQRTPSKWYFDGNPRPGFDEDVEV